MKPKEPLVPRVILEQKNKALAEMVKSREDERNTHVDSIRELSKKCATFEGAYQALYKESGALEELLRKNIATLEDSNGRLTRVLRKAIKVIST